MKSPQANVQSHMSFSICSMPSYFVAILGMLICGVLAISSLFSLAIMQMANLDNTLPEQLILASRNTLHVLPAVAALSAILLLLNQQHISWKAANAVTLTAAAIQASLGFWWKSSFKSGPVADQGTFWDVAKVLAGLQSPNDEFIDYLRYCLSRLLAAWPGNLLPACFMGITVLGRFLMVSVLLAVLFYSAASAVALQSLHVPKHVVPF